MEENKGKRSNNYILFSLNKIFILLFSMLKKLYKKNKNKIIE